MAKQQATHGKCVFNLLSKCWAQIRCQRNGHNKIIVVKQQYMFTHTRGIVCTGPQKKHLILPLL